jgi:hypothetical protein
MDQDYRHGSAMQFLFVLQSAIERKEEFKTQFLSEGQQFPIFPARQPLFRDSAAIVTG